MKIHRLTTTQYAKLVKTCCRNGDANLATFRALRVDFCVQHRLTTQAIGEITTKY